LDKENIPPDAHGDHSHVGIAEMTIRDSALSIVTGILRAYCELVSCFYSTNKTFFYKMTKKNMPQPHKQHLLTLLMLRGKKGTGNNGSEELR
jgi:hypothetical protein